MKKEQKGGALLEVIVVIFVLLILAAMLLPALQTTDRRDGRRGSCLNNLKQIVTAIKTYAPDYHGYYPTSAEPGLPIDLSTHYRDLGILYPTYIASLDVFTCCASGDEMPKRDDRIGTHDNKPFLSIEARRASYAYSYDGSSAKNLPWTEAAPSTTRILADRPASKPLTDRSNHKRDGRNVAFADGHVGWVFGAQKLLTDPDNPDPKVNDRCWWSER
jgi:prepilin-type processing-associated H-X9-DG protein